MACIVNNLVEQLGQGRPVVLVAAAKGEVGAILRGFSRAGESQGISIPQSVPEDWSPIGLADGLFLIQSGVGKVNAAAAAMIAIQDLRAGAVLNLGICGALPVAQGGGSEGAKPVELLSAIVATSSAYADEGVVLPDGAAPIANGSDFQTIAQMGFPMGPFSDEGIACSPRVHRALRRLADHSGVIATVSSCSGTDAAAATVVQRTGAIAEAMEGAAIGHVIAKWNGRLARGEAPIEFGELRVVSNSTGDRGSQIWRIREAFEKLADVSMRLAQ